jgi:hypothetical protein
MAAPRKYSEKEMEVHREYMKKYQKASSDLHKEAIKYKDHYELLAIPRNATHNEVRGAILVFFFPHVRTDDFLTHSSTLRDSVDPSIVPQARAQVPSRPQLDARGAGALGGRAGGVRHHLGPQQPHGV